MVAPSSDDDVRIRIALDVIEAIKQLEVMSQGITTFGERVDFVTSKARVLAKEYKVAAYDIAEGFKRVNKELELGADTGVLNAASGVFKSKSAGQTSGLGGIDLSALTGAQAALGTFADKVAFTEGLIKSLAQTFGVSFEQAASSLKSFGYSAGDTDKVVTKALSNVQASAGAAEKQTKSLLGSLVNFNNIARTIFGTLAALAVFQAIQFFAALGQQLVIAAQKADQLVRALVDLRNVEKLLSESGIEVSIKGLLEIISRLEEKFKLLSKIDLTELVGNLAIATREFGFTPQQIESIAQVAALLAETQNIDTKSAGEAVVRALSGRSQGNQILKQAGIFLTEEVIKNKAIELSLVKQGESLSQNVTAQTVLVLLQEKSAGLMSQIADLEASDAGKVAGVQKAWEELLTTIGTGFYGVIANGGDVLVGLIGMFEKQINSMKVIFLGFQVYVYTTAQIVRAAIAGDIKSLDDLIRISAANSEAAYRNLTSKIFKTPLKAGDILPGLDMGIVDNLNKYITAGDTATSTTENLADAFALTEEQGDKASKELEDLAEDLQKLGERADELKEKYDTALERSNEDFLQKQQRELEDFNRDVYELTLDTNNKIADAQRKHRLQEEDDERKFQERMLELRERFLFDLEDALHERDARQVLRLIRGYNLEKEQLIRQHNIDKKAREDRFREELADIRRQAAERLEQLTYEYNLRKQREEEDQAERERRRLEDYNKEKEQLAEQIRDRIDQTATALTQILGLNADKQALIASLLTAYYGPGGYFDALYDYSYASLVQKTQTMLEQLRQIVDENQPPSNPGEVPGSGGSTTPGGGPVPRNQIPMAKGGAIVANKPTNALFGEAGPELALFLPLDKLSSALSATTSSGGGNSSQPGSGSLKIDISLDDGLVADIVDSSLGAMADLVTSVNRTRK